MEVPKTLEGFIDLKELETACKEYIDFINGKYREEKEFLYENDIFEKALKTIYGNDIFSWVNKRTDEHDEEVEEKNRGLGGQDDNIL